MYFVKYVPTLVPMTKRTLGPSPLSFILPPPQFIGTRTIAIEDLSNYTHHARRSLKSCQGAYASAGSEVGSEVGSSSGAREGAVGSDGATARGKVGYKFRLASHPKDFNCSDEFEY